MSDRSQSTIRISEERSGKDTVWVARNICPESLLDGTVYCTGLTRAAVEWSLGQAIMPNPIRREMVDA